ncbi:MAG: phosphate regulon sensor histidine kinase PhoR [Gammaproteobacteria bacterium]
MKKGIEPLAERDLANLLPDTILILDRQGQLIWWNEAGKNMLNLTEKDRNLPINQLLPEINFIAYQQETPNKSITITLPQRPEIIVEITLIPYHKGQFTLLMRDVTHIHHLERMRQDFVANVSHELRTPLTVIHGYLETLRDQEINSNGNIKGIFDQMYQQSLRMQHLIEDLLLLSHLETDLPANEKFRPVSVPELLTHISKDATALSGARNHVIHLDIEPGLMIYGLENELLSAFSNIIFNAVNYTPSQGNIYIKWYKDQLGIYLMVRDEGIGIAAEHIPRLTERFYRVDKARSRLSGGTGLGLAIVKHALIHHKAHLQITSELGKGSTFTCVFSLEIIAPN